MEGSNNNKRKVREETRAVVMGKRAATDTSVTAKIVAQASSSSITVSPTAAAAATSEANVENQNTKPLLVLLPGFSGNMTKDTLKFLVPELEQIFEVRIREEEKWSGWDSVTNANNVLASGICNNNDAPWFILGFVYGNRVATTIVANHMTTTAPGLILIGYPMYFKHKPVGVNELQALPWSAKVLAISSESDQTLVSSKHAPKNNVTTTMTAKAQWDKVLEGMDCKKTTTVQFVEGGKAGLYLHNATTLEKVATTKQVTGWIQKFVVEHNGNRKSNNNN